MYEAIGRCNCMTQHGQLPHLPVEPAYICSCAQLCCNALSCCTITVLPLLLVLQMVADLRQSLKQKDDFLSLVGHQHRSCVYLM